MTELGLGPEGKLGLSSGKEDGQLRLVERGLEEERTGRAGSAQEGQRSQALAPRLGDAAVLSDHSLWAGSGGSVRSVAGDAQ